MKNSTKSPQKIWRVKTPAPALCRILAWKLGISPITAQLLINRGVCTVEQGRAFFGSELERLHPPLLLKDMEKAVARLLKAVRNREKILVYGDYDADGLTATALLVQVFRRLGAVVDYYVPNRLEEGYGLRQEALRQTLEKGTDLVVTVDCGISAMQEACWAKENGLDLIITDHHEPPSEMPPAFAVINPKRPDCMYPFKELAGVGVALKLAQALLESAGEESEAWQDYLYLFCIGTIADIVPIRGENRILVKHGLPWLANTGNPGLQALMTVSGINKEDLGTREVGFGLAPRLNAAGRIGSPDLAVRLLLTDNIGEAQELAFELNKGNQTRQKIEAAVLEEALKQLEEKPEQGEAQVLVLASEDWHPGVIGIVASRLMDRFYRPVLLIALDGSVGKGSARSIPDFHLYKSLTHCREHLLDYGGHALAAGFSIERCKIEDFRRDLNRYAQQIIGDKKMVPRLDLDGIIEVGQVSEELVNEINLLRPFGHLNPDPLLGCRKALVLESRGVGRGAAHLKLRLRCEKGSMDGIGFNLGAYAESLSTAEAVDLAFVPDINEYNGRRSVQLKVKDLGIPAIMDPPGQVNREVDFLKGKGFTPDGELPGDLEKLFMPEFVVRTLDSLKNQPLLEQGDYHKQLQNIKLIDNRGSIDRPGQLVELAGGGEPTLVVTSCGYQTIELAHYLQLVRPALRGKTVYYHDYLSEDVRSVLVARFEAGDIKTLVATPGMTVSIGRYANQVLLYHLPYTVETITCAMNTMQPDGRLYLLFGPEDLEDNLAGLEVLAPNRDYLACLYKILRREENGSVGSSINLDLARTAHAMLEAGFPYSRKQTVEVALAILEELGLLISNREGNSLRVELYPRPSVKRDLLEAQTYKQLHQIKEESTTWMKKLLKEPLHNLLSL